MRSHGEAMTLEFATEVRRLSKLGFFEKEIVAIMKTTRHRVAWARRKYNIASATAHRNVIRDKALGQHYGPRVPESPFSAAGPAIGEWGKRYLEPEGLDVAWTFEDHPNAPAREPIWRPRDVVLP